MFVKKILFLLLISGGLFAQTKYPYKSFLNGDTVCVLSLKNVKQINLTFVRLDFQEALTDSFRVISKEQQATITLQDANISSYKSDMKIKQNIIENDHVIIDVYKTLDSKNQRQIRFLKLERNILAIAVGVAILKIFVFK